MRTRYHTAVQEHHLALEQKQAEGRKVGTKSRRRFRWGAGILAVLAILFVAIIIYIGRNTLLAANNIFASKISVGDILSKDKSALKQTDGRTNILVLGKGGANHPGGQLTDTIQLVSINQSDKRVAMVSFPRDMQVTVPGAGSNKVNSAYSTGWEKEKDQNKKAEAGAELSRKVMENVVGVPIHYYITLDFVGFKDFIDTLGGVSVNVEQDIYDPFYPKDSFKDDKYTKTDAYQTFVLKKGVQTLNGETALKYARSRYTTSDFDRSKRQQNLLFAIKEKALSLGVLSNPKKISDLVSGLGNHIKTNLSLAEFKEIINIAQNTDKSKVINKVVDNNTKDGLLVSVNEGGYYLKPKGGSFSAIQKLVKDVFTTGETQVASTSDNAQIEVYNASGVTGLGGKIADQLKKEGLNIAKVEKNPTLLEETTIYDGSGDSSILAKIKAKFDSVQIKPFAQKGIIKLVIGKSYGN